MARIRLFLLGLWLVSGVCDGAAALADPAYQWSDLYDGGGHYVDYGTAALIDADGDLYVGGECNDGQDGSDMLIRKLDRDSGTTLWTASYSAFDGNDMALSGMVWDGFGSLLVGGYIRGCDT